MAKDKETIKNYQIDLKNKTLHIERKMIWPLTTLHEKLLNIKIVPITLMEKNYNTFHLHGRHPNNLDR